MLAFSCFRTIGITPVLCKTNSVRSGSCKAPYPLLTSHSPLHNHSHRFFTKGVGLQNSSNPNFFPLNGLVNPTHSEIISLRPYWGTEKRRTLTGVNERGEYCYEGETTEGWPHGRGKLTFLSEDIGLSDMIFPPWCSYQGTFERGCPKHVKYTDSWGSQVIGEFSQNLKILKGRGIYIVHSKSQQSATYEGIWANGKCTGKFKLSKPMDDIDPILYEGDMKGGQWPIGKCMWTEKTGAKYDGEVILDTNGNKVFRGKSEGKLDHNESKIDITYEGDLPFSKGNTCRGKMVLTNAINKASIIYEGEFDSTMEIKTGKRIDPLSTYEGQFFEGKRFKGKATYARDPSFDWSGCVYEGNWLKDKWHGIGQLIQYNGLIYVGNFEDGNPKGLGLVANLAGFRELRGLFPRPPTIPGTIGKIGLNYGEWNGVERIKTIPPPIGVTQIKLNKGVVIGIEVDKEGCGLVLLSKGEESQLTLQERLLLSFLPQLT